MKNKEVFIKGVGCGKCVEEICQMILVEFKGVMAWVDLRQENVEVVG